MARISRLREIYIPVNNRKEKKECDGEGIGDEGLRSVGWGLNPKELVEESLHLYVAGRISS